MRCKGSAPLDLDNQLVQCYSLPEMATVPLGLVWESGQMVFDDLTVWELDL